MSELFLHLVNRGLAAGWLVLAILVLRPLLARAPGWVRPAMWGLVGLRLVLPVTVESALSLLPSAETVSPAVMADPSPAIHTGIAAVNSAVNPLLGRLFAPQTGDSANPLQIWVPVLAAVWLAGVCLLLLYAVLSAWRLRRRVASAVCLRDNIYQSEAVPAPFVLGLIRPRIYLPFRMPEGSMDQVLAHERAHVRRRDHWWKPLGFLLLAVYWFHPLLWLGYALFCRDVETACDEAVIRDLDRAGRGDYAQALADWSAPERRVSPCPLAFGETGVKGRVRRVLRYRRPKAWTALAGAALCLLLAGCFLTDPVEPGKMTLADVLALSEKGTDLTWGDLEEFTDYTETGSGLYIRLYAVDDSAGSFVLAVGGGMPRAEDSVMYAHLSEAEGEAGDWVDIREGDVAAFLRDRR